MNKGRTQTENRQKATRPPLPGSINFFYRFARFVYDHPLAVLFLMSCLIGFLTCQIPGIEINTSPEALLSRNDPGMLQYNDFQDQFGRSEQILIMVTAKEIFSHEVLSELKRFHDELEREVPFVRSVTSLVNIRALEGQEDTLVVKGFLEDYPDEEEGLDTLKAKAAASRLYDNYILSTENGVTAVIIETQAVIYEDRNDTTGEAGERRYFSAEENAEVVSAVNAVVAKYHRPGFLLTPSGGPVIENAFNEATLADIKRCILLSLAVVAFFLILLFRNLCGVILPMVIVVSCLLSTLGLMAFVHVPIKITTIVIPAFLLSVGVADSVHVLSIFFKRHRATGDKKEAIAYSLGYSGPAIMMTSITTAAGLLSFSVVDLSAIAEVGYLSACGVALAFVYTVCLLPAIIAVMPVNTPLNEKKASGGLDHFLCATAAFACRYPTPIVAVSIILFLLQLPFLQRNQFSHNIIEFFPDDAIEKQRLFAIDNLMKGSLTLDLVLDTGKENGVCDPNLLNRIDLFSRELAAIRMDGLFVGKIISLNDVVKEIHQALHDGKPEAYAIPRHHDAIAQELLLFESGGGTDLEKLVDQQMRKTRMVIKTKWVDAVVCQRFILEIEALFTRIFQNDTQLTVTGLMAILSQAITSAIYSMADSYTIAVVVISAMMVLLLKSLPLGLLSMIPNIFPIVIILGLMGLFKAPFDLNALMVGSVAIGVLVDNTVHLMYNFQRYYRETGDAANAMQQTFLGTGKAMLITSLVLSSGFFVLFAATLTHVVMFGLLTGSIILLALVFDFLLMPALCFLSTAKKASA